MHNTRRFSAWAVAFIAKWAAVFLTTASLAAMTTTTFGAGTADVTEYRVGSLVIADPWSRPTAPVAVTGAVYLTITNHGSADRLIALATPLAHEVQIHESRTAGGMMQMRQLTALPCPPHAVVKIEPGGIHIMLLGLVRPLASGSDFPLALRFQNAGEVTIQVHVGERE